MLTEQAFSAPGPSWRQLPLSQVLGEPCGFGVWHWHRPGRRPATGAFDVNRLHILDSDRISSAACANSWTRLTSGRTVTSTRRTLSGSPFGGCEEFIDVTWSVTE